MNSADLFKQSFSERFNLSIKDWELFEEMGEIISVNKETTLKEHGETERYLYFILKGSGGLLLWSKNNYICINICHENTFFGDYMSFLSGKPSSLEVITFEKSTIFRISKTNFDKLTNASPIGDKICRNVAEGLFMYKQQQQIDILTKTAKERYEELQSTHPEIIQQTPQKYISSFLGITPQSLSRIRKELALH